MYMAIKYNILLLSLLILAMTFTYSSASKGALNNTNTEEFVKKQVVHNGKTYDVSVNSVDKDKVDSNIVNNIVTNHPEANNIIIYEIGEK